MKEIQLNIYYRISLENKCLKNFKLKNPIFFIRLKKRGILEFFLMVYLFRGE